MNVNIRMPKDLRASWEAVVRRQVAYRLASMAPAICMLDVNLTVIAEPGFHLALRCDLSAQLTDGRREDVAATGPMATCVADAAARLARGMARNVKLRENR